MQTTTVLRNNVRMAGLLMITITQTSITVQKILASNITKFLSYQDKPPVVLKI